MNSRNSGKCFEANKKYAEINFNINHNCSDALRRQRTLYRIETTFIDLLSEFHYIISNIPNI